MISNFNYGVKIEEIYCPPCNRSIMGALLLVVLSCNTFEETMVNLYTSVFGGLAWAQSPGLAAGVLGPLHDNPGK